MMRKIANRLLGIGSPIGSPPKPLRQISRDIANDLDPNQSFDDLWNSLDEADGRKALLFEYCEQQPGIPALLEEFKVSREDLEELYDELVSVGAGQWRSGHWIAASALAYSTSVRYLLNNWKGELKTETAFKSLMYFERGEALE